jgi:charged multivesicular body protein 2A
MVTFGIIACVSNFSFEFFAIMQHSHLQGCALKLQTVKSHQAMADAMQSTAKAMHKMNKSVNVQTISKMMAEFERENMKTEMMQEMMGDAIDDALNDNPNAEEEEDVIVNQVLDEIGVSFGEELPEAAGLGGLNKVSDSTAISEGQKIASPIGGSNDDPALSDLEARLNNLKR